MSAIAGIVLHDGGTPAEQLLQRIVAATRHVRCDEVGSWSGEGVGLLHFNLATTPEAQREKLPLFDQDAALSIVLDGRIDNRAELLAMLRSFDPIANDCGDGELVLALFRKYGTECVQHLTGDYSVAIWQARTRQLFCARSPVGWRPFLWHNSAERFAFATEPRTLIAGVGVDRQLNEGAMGEFLAMRFTSPTETLWRGIYRVPPGGAIMVERGTVREWYWHQGPFPESAPNEDEAVERFLALFDQSLDACMRSNGDVAAHLSGGLDSSSVVCRATALHRAGRIARPVRPLSARFPGEAHDESDWCAAVESHVGVGSLIVLPRAYDWDRARSWCAETLHLPLRPNTLSTVIGSCAMMQTHGMRVLLTGEGGDDWLSGSHEHWPDLLRSGRVHRLWSETHDPNHPGYLRRIKRFLAEGAAPLLLPSRRRQLRFPHLDFSHAIPPWMRPEWAAAIGLVDRWREAKAPMKLPSFAQQRRAYRYAVARTHVNVDNVLAMAARCGVEMRHPLHDLRITHFLMGVPGGLLRRHGESKYLLRQAMHGTLPEQIRTRQSKASFNEPSLHALSAILDTVAIKDLLCVRMGWVDAGYLARTLAAHRAWHRGGAPGPRPQERLAALWSAVAASLWMEEALRLT